jgi:hypothetical protein
MRDKRHTDIGRRAHCNLSNVKKVGIGGEMKIKEVKYVKKKPIYFMKRTCNLKVAVKGKLITNDYSIKQNEMILSHDGVWL